MDERDDPVARPTVDEGHLLVLTEEDAGRLAADAYCWLIQFPQLDRAAAEEIATWFYEMLTGEWSQTLSRDDTDT